MNLQGSGETINMGNRRWIDVARGASLLSPSGVVAPTIFAEMSELATRTGAVNLG